MFIKTGFLFPDNSYLCLAVLRGVLCVISLHGRTSPHNSPSATPCVLKSPNFEAQLEDLQEKLLKPMHYARSGLGTAELDRKLIAAGMHDQRLIKVSLITFKYTCHIHTTIKWF